jgi:L-amino acid N-acyltransferase YncA
MDGVGIRELRATDWPAVSAIYGEGIETGDATLERGIPSWLEWDAGHRSDCRLVATRGDEVIGWTALSGYSGRAVYSGVAWESVYVAARARGSGVGRLLLEVLIERSEAAGIWTVLAGVQIENAASLALHERAGFRRIGLQERVGRDPTGRWRDVVLLERRSTLAGV